MNADGYVSIAYKKKIKFIKLTVSGSMKAFPSKVTDFSSLKFWR